MSVTIVAIYSVPIGYVASIVAQPAFQKTSAARRMTNPKHPAEPARRPVTSDSLGVSRNSVISQTDSRDDPLFAFTISGPRTVPQLDRGDAEQIPVTRPGCNSRASAASSRVSLEVRRTLISPFVSGGDPAGNKAIQTSDQEFVLDFFSIT